VAAILHRVFGVLLLTVCPFNTPLLLRCRGNFGGLFGGFTKQQT
jgi:hypothetical protein